VTMRLLAGLLGPGPTLPLHLPAHGRGRGLDRVSRRPWLAAQPARWDLPELSLDRRALEAEGAGGGCPGECAWPLRRLTIAVRCEMGFKRLLQAALLALAPPGSRVLLPATFTAKLLHGLAFFAQLRRCLFRPAFRSRHPRFVATNRRPAWMERGAGAAGSRGGPFVLVHPPIRGLAETWRVASPWPNRRKLAGAGRWAPRGPFRPLRGCQRSCLRSGLGGRGGRGCGKSLQQRPPAVWARARGACLQGQRVEPESAVGVLALAADLQPQCPVARPPWRRPSASLQQSRARASLQRALGIAARLRGTAGDSWPAGRRQSGSRFRLVAEHGRLGLNRPGGRRRLSERGVNRRAAFAEPGCLHLLSGQVPPAAVEVGACPSAQPVGRVPGRCARCRPFSASRCRWWPRPEAAPLAWPGVLTSEAVPWPKAWAAGRPNPLFLSRRAFPLLIPGERIDQGRAEWLQEQRRLLAGSESADSREVLWSEGRWPWRWKAWRIDSDPHTGFKWCSQVLALELACLGFCDQYVGLYGGLVLMAFGVDDSWRIEYGPCRLRCGTAGWLEMVDVTGTVQHPGSGTLEGRRLRWQRNGDFAIENLHIQAGQARRLHLLPPIRDRVLLEVGGTLSAVVQVVWRALQLAAR